MKQIAGEGAVGQAVTGCHELIRLASWAWQLALDQVWSKKIPYLQLVYTELKLTALNLENLDWKNGGVIDECK